MASWVSSANDPATDFPLENLPFGVFSHAEGQPRIGIAVGDQVLDLRLCAQARLLAPLDAEVKAACTEDSLNRLMALGNGASTSVRRRIAALLAAEDRAAEHHVAPLLTPAAHVRMHPPASIGDYTDFYASIEHARNVGRLLRPDHPLLPNYKHLPIGYHGRASSIVVSGTEIRRPSGQRQPAHDAAPVFGPTESLDYELELGCFVAEGNALGEPVPIDQAESKLFGLCLLNDWSARDIQAWEYQPLGPFLAKSFATSISPWVVTMDALAPFRQPLARRHPDDPQLLPYLDPGERETNVDVQLEILLGTRKMRNKKACPVRIAQTGSAQLYWSLSQMIAHHTSNGCNLRPGDLVGTGTISGSVGDSLGSLLEATQRGAQPLKLPNGETRAFLEDGDEVILRGWCEAPGAVRIGLGECRGIVLKGSGR